MDHVPLTILSAGPQVKAKAKWMAEEGETQIWLLATAAEADQLKDGLVPEDIRRQATIALDAVHDTFARATPEKPKRRRKGHTS
jgi:hypothetical protein